MSDTISAIETMVQMKKENTVLREQLAKAQKDTARLEWLARNATAYHGMIYDTLKASGDNWRDAIDKAREASNE